MHRISTQRVLVLAGASVLALGGLTACGHSKSATASAFKTVASASHSASKMSTSSASPSTTNRSTASGSKKCSAKEVVGTIGGAQKCLAVGEQCSKKHLSDYGQYGFKCTAKNNEYVLEKA